MKSFTAFALAAVLAPAAFAQHQTFVVNPDPSSTIVRLSKTGANQRLISSISTLKYGA